MKSKTLLALFVFAVNYFVCAPSAVLFAQGSDAALTAFAEVSSASVKAASPFLLSVYVDHDAPGDVRIFTPDFRGNFSTAAVRSFPRFMRRPGEAAGRVWTVFEFSLIPQKPGVFNVEAFTGEVNSSRFTTNPLQIRVEGTPGSENSNPAVSFVWEIPKKRLAIGEEGMVILRFRGNLPNKNEIFNEKLWFPPPKELILENLALSNAEKDSDICLKLRIIPLKRPPSGIIEIIPPKIKDFSLENVTITVSGSL
jgi:hypothetical protein